VEAKEAKEAREAKEAKEAKEAREAKVVKVVKVVKVAGVVHHQTAPLFQDSQTITIHLIILPILIPVQDNGRMNVFREELSLLIQMIFFPTILFHLNIL
jgi:hypothetical protein